MTCKTCEQPIEYTLLLPDGVHVLPAGLFATTKPTGERGECDFCRLERRLAISRAAIAAER